MLHLVCKMNVNCTVDGSDYKDLTTNLTFGPSTIQHNVSIRTLDDEIYEVTESFTVSLTLLMLPEDRVAIEPNIANVTILDNDCNGTNNIEL